MGWFMGVRWAGLWEEDGLVYGKKMGWYMGRRWSGIWEEDGLVYGKKMNWCVGEETEIPDVKFGMRFTL